MSGNHKVIASIATIPPRIFNGDLKKCIDSLLSQTYPVEKIFVAMPEEYTRFKGPPIIASYLPDWLNEEPYKNRVILLRPKTDPGSISKYLCIAKYLQETSLPLDNNPDPDPFIFVGDDDQVYNRTLIEKMLTSLPSDKIVSFRGVIQNHYEKVRFGSGGIIHGFVGLLIRASCLQKLPDFQLAPNGFCVDDQVMSIYCAYNNIPIIPSKIELLSDIYGELVNGREKGVHAPEALHMAGDRNQFVFQLQQFYNIEFIYGGQIKLLNQLTENTLDSKFYSLPCFIVNIDRCKERYSFSYNNVKNAGFTDIRRFKGIDAKVDNLDEAWAIHGSPRFNKADVNFNKMLGHQGCMLSHLHLWRHIIDNSLEYAIVFEDDVRFHCEWQNIAHLYVHHTPADFDILYLGSQIEARTDARIAKVPVYCTHAYMISLAGAKKLYSLILNEASGVRTIDIMLINNMYKHFQNPQYVPFIWYAWNATMIPDMYKKNKPSIEKRNSGLVFQDDTFESEVSNYDD